jgi:DNA gyrase subunit A
MVIDICKELGQNFIDFSYEANSCRAFADARDGLKPGQRACLWEMFDKGYLSNKPHVKSAKIAGAVTGNWWPHGDVAIYETFARMSQPWINNIPEVDWHGNNGSQYTGPECASSRYTEARLSKAIENGMFKGIKKNNVNMILNFSEDAEWPEVLPAVLPRLMVNGCQGIGSTIANVWLPHTLSDVANVILKYMETKEIDTKNLFPSFPTGGIIINKNDIHTIYETGKGKVVLRGKAEIKNNTILITELPYQIYAQPYVEKVTEMAIKGDLVGVAAVYNKSGKDKLLIEIECDGSAEKVLKQLYTKTDLQKNYNANQWALVGKTPKLLTLKDYCDIYIAHNIDCLLREKKFDLDKAKARLEVVQGLLIALEDIDNVIALIKNSESAAAAKVNLMNKYKLSENQAKAILAMKLSSLAKLEKMELEKEQEELFSEIEYCERVLSARLIQESIVHDRLEGLAQGYRDVRKTELMQIDIKPEEKEIIEVVPEDCVVVTSQLGNIKRVPSNTFKTQRRNGKGVKNEDEAILSMIATNTIDNLLVFTNKGKMYKILVDNIPSGTNAAKGVNLNSLINLEVGEKAIAITSLDRKNDKKYVVFITKQGLFKKTELSEYTSMKKSTGVAAIKLKDGDSIANVTFANEEEFILVSKKGLSIRFETKDIAAIGRVTSGVKAMKLAEDDEVLVGLPIINTKENLAVFTVNGYAKQVALSEFPIQGKNGKGVKVASESLAGAMFINDTNNVLLIGKPNNICIAATEIPLLSRISLGNIMIKNAVTSVVKI